MTMVLSQAIQEIQNKFEGGTSFDINWYDLFHEAAKEMRKEINPRTAKRRVPIYGGISADVPVLTCPSDVQNPAGLYVGEQMFGGRKFRYQAPQAFYESFDAERFTIDYINGTPFILCRTNYGGSVTLQDFSDPSDFTGVSLALTQRNFIYGSGALYGTFTDAAYAVNWNFETTQDLSNYARGVALIPFYAADISKVASVTLKLRVDATNYFQVTSTVDSIGDTFLNGWNLARFDMVNKTEVGSPVISTIDSAILEIPQTSGQSQEITIDKISLHKSVSAFFEYHTTKLFTDASGNLINKPTATTDIINLPDDETDILIYEVCRLVVQNATYDGIDSKESARFDSSLERKYKLYNQNFPSSEMPLTYNISSEISKDPLGYLIN